MRYPPEGTSDWTVRERITTKNTENFWKKELRTQRKQKNEVQGMSTEVERKTITLYFARAKCATHLRECQIGPCASG